MPYQRKDQNLLTTSVTIDRLLAESVKIKGYSLSDLLNVAMETALNVDGQMQLQYEHYQKMRDMLAQRIGAELEAKRDAAEKEKQDKERIQKEENSRAREQQKREQELLFIVARHTPLDEGKRKAITAAINENRLSAAVIDSLQRKIMADLKGLDYSEGEVLGAIHTLVKQDWKVVCID